MPGSFKRAKTQIRYIYLFRFEKGLHKGDSFVECNPLRSISTALTYEFKTSSSSAIKIGAGVNNNIIVFDVLVFIGVLVILYVVQYHYYYNIYLINQEISSNFYLFHI
jgi:hypothetical protein